MKGWHRIAIVTTVIVMVILFLTDPTVRIGIGEGESDTHTYYLLVPWLIGGIINFIFWILVGLFRSKTVPWILKRFKKIKNKGTIDN
jgi:predicted Kef-type K+ transport protein